MTRNYNIEWYRTKEFNPIHRTAFIKLSNPTGETSKDAKAALGIFITANGNLKKNTIVKIIEMDENGQIGEDIVPTDGENAIIPIGR